MQGSLDRVITVRPRVAQAHAARTAAAADDTLQQCVAFARYAGPARIVTIEVVHQLPAVRHELIPVDISRVSILETDRPILGRDGHYPNPLAARLPAQR